ncbi:MAG: outer membrane beta-barrel domain-containing protein [Gammaproteobacteria bacterium]|nr:outer membrane beta-barrel domain-containing protein [Gammaproteobacteria bacterium]
METRFRRILLTALMLCYSSLLVAQQPAADDDSVMIEPSIERIEFDEAQIDTEDLEILLMLGYLSIEDFGVNELLQFNLNYHVNESIFVQVSFGQSDGGETSYEIITQGAPLLTPSERELSYYNINIGYNLLPGEAFLGDQLAHNTAFYLSAGIGVTEFAGDDRFTINYGAGYRFLLNDATGIYTDFRNHVFDMDTFGENKATNNLAFTLGISWFF